jgi:hypothetical protein
MILNENKSSNNQSSIEWDDLRNKMIMNEL